MNITTGFAALSYAASRPATAPSEGTMPTGGAAAVLEAAKDFASTLQEGEAVAKAAMTAGADPHTLVQALVQTELAVETAVAVRDRVVEAYQEILRMPV